MTTRVVTCANLKGGVTKTTTTIQLAHNLAKRGRTVLVIDGDPDICATEALDLEAPPTEHALQEKTIFSVLANPKDGIAHIVRTYTGTTEHPITYPGRLDVLPGSRRITRAPAAFEGAIARQPVAAFEAVPAWIVREFCQEYEYVLIDPSPSRDRLTETLLFAANGAIAPVSAEALPKRGVLNLMRILRESNVERATFRIPGETRLLGILIGKIYPDQEEDARQFLAKLDEKRIPRFQTTISYTRAAYTCPEYCVPIDVYAPTDRAALQFHALTDEVEALF